MENQDCPKSLYILRLNDSLKSSIWLSSCPHEHKSLKPFVLPPKSVEHIKKLFEEKTKWTNNEIISSLRRNNCPQLTKPQINNLKSRMKQKRIGTANCLLYQLKEWAERKSLIPDDEDEIFCGGFDFVEENDVLIDLRIFVTTKRLIALIKISHKTYADGNFYFFSLFPSLSLLYFNQLTN